MSGQGAVCVEVDQAEKTVQDVGSRTTAREIIEALKLSCDRKGPQILLEVWNGCCRRINNEERVCEILNEWGDDVKNVKLVLTNNSKQHYSSRGQTKTRAHGRIALKKRRVYRQRVSKQVLAHDIQKLIKLTRARQKQIAILTTPKKTSTNTSKLSDPSSLPVDQQEECVALQEELAEEHKENADLQRRRTELGDRISSQENEMESLKKTISNLEARVTNERHKLSRLEEGKHNNGAGNTELEGSKKEIMRLQGELKLRVKLNQLQSAKMQELSRFAENTKVAVKQCTEKIDELKMQLD